MRTLHQRAMAPQVPQQRLLNIVCEILGQLLKANTNHLCEDARELLLIASDL
jgi:hypothetical protein